MKVAILAGGFGTRLSEYTDAIPKPMVEIGGIPIVCHIMQSYASYGFNNFYLALGYKAGLIKDFFLNYSLRNSNFTISMGNGKIDVFDKNKIEWNVSLVDTGTNSMTGGRLKRMQNIIGNKTFMATYGDGVSNIDLRKLLNFHKSHGKIATVSAVHPAARFGELEISNSSVINFSEKPQMNQGWINGGFFVFEPEIFDLIENDSTVLEQYPMEQLSSMGELMAYKHEGFWQCMDTRRDKALLDDMYSRNCAPWIK
jgi:glucose-1-phosphate cytidylyltransferase